MRVTGAIASFLETIPSQMSHSNPARAVGRDLPLCEKTGIPDAPFSQSSHFLSSQPFIPEMLQKCRHSLRRGGVPLVCRRAARTHRWCGGARRGVSACVRATLAEAETSASVPASAFSIAPMMEYTTVHFRAFARILTRRALLYTEMEVDQTLIHNAAYRDRYLPFPADQHSVALQLGGSDPASMRRAAAYAAPFGYDEVNLNAGCPSETVAGKGCFGAALMRQPLLVAELCTSMREGLASAVLPGAPVPEVTVKHRLGVDDSDSYAELRDFIGTVSERGSVSRFIVHGRIALLNGISPADNRSIPPLRPGWVAALRRDFPHLSFDYNGGLSTATEVARARADGPLAGAGFMIGRAAYARPWDCLSNADVAVFGEDAPSVPSRRVAIERYAEYCDDVERLAADDGELAPNPRVLVKPVLNLFHGERGCGNWKRSSDYLLRQAKLRASNADSTTPRTSDLLHAMMRVIDDDVLDAPPPPASFSGNDDDEEEEDSDSDSPMRSSMMTLPGSATSRAGLGDGVRVVVSGRRRRKKAQIVYENGGEEEEEGEEEGKNLKASAAA